MNKFAVLAALFGLVALASCGPVNLENDGDEFSQLQIKPDDDGEVQYLAEEHKIFDDYCKRSRDHVYTYISSSKDGLISKLFAAFYDSIGDVIRQLEQLEYDEAVKAEKTIMEAETGAETIFSAGLIKTVARALKAYITALGQAALQEVVARVTLLKKSVNSENFKEMLSDTCTDIQLKLIRELQTMFKETKAEIVADSPTPETQNMLSNATFEKVICLTSSRVRKVVNVCGVISAAGPTIYEMMGI